MKAGWSLNLPVEPGNKVSLLLDHWVLLIPGSVKLCGIQCLLHDGDLETPQMMGRGVGFPSWVKRGAYLVRGTFTAQSCSVPGWPFLWLPGLLGSWVDPEYGLWVSYCPYVVGP